MKIPERAKRPVVPILQGGGGGKIHGTPLQGVWLRAAEQEKSNEENDPLKELHPTNLPIPFGPVNSFDQGPSRLFQTLKGAKDPLSSLGAELRPCGIVGEESLGLLEEKVDFREGLVTDALPADATGGIYEEGSVEGNFFEIVVGPVGPEGGELGIGDKGKGNGVASFFIGFKGLGELGLGLGADGDDFEARFRKASILGAMAWSCSTQCRQPNPR